MFNSSTTLLPLGGQPAPRDLQYREHARPP
jgi:hypothetical protein